MALLGILKSKNSPSPSDVTIFTSLVGPKIDREDVAMLRELMNPIEVKINQAPDESIQSLSVPRTKLREKILADAYFRRALRNINFQLQDVSGKVAKMSGPMQANAYVKDTKYNRLEHGSSNHLVPLHVQISWLENVAGDWGYVRIPAILLLTIVGFIGYGAVRLAT